MEMETKGQLLHRSAVILYGTETGTSQDLAEEVSRSLQRMHFVTDTVECDAVSYPQLASYDLAIFAISTTGQGDFPTNARKFWTSLLRKRLTPETLTGIEYALVGIGDSSYPKFNWAARKLDKRLKQLGAVELIEACEADEQGDEGIDGAFLAWMRTFREAILSRFPFPPGFEQIPDNVRLRSKWQLCQDDVHSILPVNGQYTNGSSNTTKLSLANAQQEHTFTVTLECNTRVTPTEHWQDVRLLKFQTREYIDYLPGDALAISPRNVSTDVESLIKQMGWNDIADMQLILRSNQPHVGVGQLNHLPIPLMKSLTIRLLLTEHLDINAIPKRSFFGAIANHTSNDMHKERLLEFTDPQFLDEYYDYATRPRRSILEILQEFDSIKLPWQEIINIFPRLRPRQFSIASGGNLKTNNSGTSFEMLIAIVKYRTIIKRLREGVCTRYLAQLPVGSTIDVVLKKEGRFSKRQELMEKNHILIGAGTGIAPLRSLVHEKLDMGITTTTTLLIFGARSADSDYFFESEWMRMSEKPGGKSVFNFDIITAFSRDQKHKIYVQDRIREHSSEISRLLQQSHTHIVICGASGQMPKAVRQALVDVLRANLPFNDVSTDFQVSQWNTGVSEDEAEAFLVGMEKEGRYNQETWS